MRLDGFGVFVRDLGSMIRFYRDVKALGRNARDPTEDLTYYNAEMQEATEAYAAFVMEQVA